MAVMSCLLWSTRFNYLTRYSYANSMRVSFLTTKMGNLSAPLIVSPTSMINKLNRFLSGRLILNRVDWSLARLPQMLPLFVPTLLQLLPTLLALRRHKDLLITRAHWSFPNLNLLQFDHNSCFYQETLMANRCFGVKIGPPSVGT